MSLKLSCSGMLKLSLTLARHIVSKQLKMRVANPTFFFIERHTVVRRLTFISISITIIRQPQHIVKESYFLSLASLRILSAIEDRR